MTVAHVCLFVSGCENASVLIARVLVVNAGIKTPMKLCRSMCLFSPVFLVFFVLLFRRTRNCSPLMVASAVRTEATENRENERN